MIAYASWWIVQLSTLGLACLCVGMGVGFAAGWRIRARYTRAEGRGPGLVLCEVSPFVRRAFWMDLADRVRAHWRKRGGENDGLKGVLK